jgi:hypothetical protein
VRLLRRRQRRFLVALALVDTIIAVVAQRYGLKREVMCGPRRDHWVVHPRMLAMYTIRFATDLSYPEIGRLFGGRHHTTVINAMETVEAWMEEDPGLRMELLTIACAVIERSPSEQLASPQQESRRLLPVEPQGTKQLPQWSRGAGAVEAAVERAEPPVDVAARRAS